MNKNQILTWAATAIVSIGVTFVVRKALGPRLAAILGPAAGIFAHQLLDHRVAKELQRALG
jgi:hypothetical protein